MKKISTFKKQHSLTGRLPDIMVFKYRFERFTSNSFGFDGSH
jgi:hypothetical protein